MELLRGLGIDGKLLLAQVLNFGLLLFLLKKFLYQPIIQRIEKDEAQLEEAKRIKEELTKEKARFEEEKRKRRQKTQKRAQEIIQEAEEIAEKIKRKKEAEAKKEKEAALKQARQEWRSQEPKLRERLLQELTGKLKHRLHSSLKNSLPPNWRRELQENLFSSFLLEVKKIELERLKEADLVAILEKLNSKKGGGRRKLEEEISQRIGPVVWEFAFPPKQNQEEKLRQILEEKIGLSLKITKKENKELLAGFRLEVAGRLIERSLAQIINDGLKISE